MYYIVLNRVSTIIEKKEEEKKTQFGPTNLFLLPSLNVIFDFALAPSLSYMCFFAFVALFGFIATQICFFHIRIITFPLLCVCVCVSVFFSRDVSWSIISCIAQHTTLRSIEAEDSNLVSVLWIISFLWKLIDVFNNNNTNVFWHVSLTAKPKS